MFTKYIENFLALLDRFVVAYEVRNEILAAGKDGETKTAQREVARADEPQTGEQTQQETGGRGRGRSRASSAGGGEQQQPSNDEQQADAGAGNTGGRRSRTRAGGDTQQADAGAETGGRRSRTRAGTTETKQETKEPEKPKLTPEQADLLAEIERLAQLAGDVDACTEEVKEFWKAEGWGVVASSIPADDLEWALEEMNKIVDKYFD